MKDTDFTTILTVTCLILNDSGLPERYEILLVLVTCCTI